LSPYRAMGRPHLQRMKATGASRLGVTAPLRDRSMFGGMVPRARPYRDQGVTDGDSSHCRPRPRGEHAEDTQIWSHASGAARQRRPVMEVLYRVCCRLDVHKKTVVACLRFPGPNRKRAEAVRTFGTTTRELLRLADWLTAAGCTHIAMESTGVYWRPVSQILEGGFELLLVNAQHVKAVP